MCNACGRVRDDLDPCMCGDTECTVKLCAEEWYTCDSPANVRCANCAKRMLKSHANPVDDDLHMCHPCNTAYEADRYNPKENYPYGPI
jgi:hypothetical protein